MQLFLLIVLAVLSLSTTYVNAKPNILFLMADEMDGRVLDPASPQFHPPMPNLKALALKGASFTTAYNQAPQCVPSRTSMMVGLRTDQLRVWDNSVGGIAVNGDATNLDPRCANAIGLDFCSKYAKLQNAPATFIDRLNASGYNVTLYGKMHAGFGLDRYSGSIYEFPFNNGATSSQYGRELTRGLGPAINVKGVSQANSAPSPPKDEAQPASQNDYATLDSCLTQLRAGLFSDPEGGQFLYCSILVPHPTYATNATYLKALANLTIDPIHWVPLNESHPSDVASSTQQGLADASNFDPAGVENFRRVYFSMCYEADNLLGQIVNAVDQNAKRDSTYIMMVSDHGEDAIEHRMIGKNNMYDSGSRVAMVLSGPDVTPGQEITALTSLNDVYPTVLDMAGISDLPSNLPGSSLFNLLLNKSSVQGHTGEQRKDYVIGQYHSVYSVTGLYMVRKGPWKYIAYAPNQYGTQAEKNWPVQLFNLDSDPWELHNIAAANPDKVKELGDILHSEVDVEGTDLLAKSFQKDLFMTHTWQGADKCQSVFDSIYGSGTLTKDDAKVIEQWTGESCPFN